ncbi:MAG TPA: hypothetical protein VET23_02455 [Chitinophagaceae bacterium]|nr:hypothetical protein [Chitinophagaceae bacterium]
MMPNRSTDILFQLVRSLEKSEKRHFKLYIKRSSGNSDLKIIRLFDVLDKLPDYDEALVLKKMSGVTKPQLNNLKQHLYKQLLAALLLLKTNDTTDLQLSELLDYARVLYHKGLKLQSLKQLEKAKELARENHKFNYLAQVISLEKKIETLHITRSSLQKAGELSTEASEISWHIDSVVKLSNLALQLYSWYIKNGHARNKQDGAGIEKFFKAQLPSHPERITDFYELLYLYQSYCWYAYIRQDYLMYYRYSSKWIRLYKKEPLMVSVETGHYIKGMHNLLNAHFVLRNFKEFEITLKDFEAFSQTPVARQHDNFYTHTFIYINSARLNQHLMQGTFNEGLKLIPAIEQKLQEYSLFVDNHRILVFNYKIASLYFGSGNYSKAIDYLQKIIHGSDELRIDLQCYARLLHLLSHYELGNDEIIESFSKSTYRFMSKMKNLTVVEEEIFRFLRKAFELTAAQLKPELEIFLSNIKHLEKNLFETRSFAYLDIISWLESKVYNKPMGEIIYNKYLQSKHKSLPVLQV